MDSTMDKIMESNMDTTMDCSKDSTLGETMDGRAKCLGKKRGLCGKKKEDYGRKNKVFAFNFSQ